ncbi:MAG: PAS domain-containing protein [Thermomicrobiales bacterium]
MILTRSRSPIERAASAWSPAARYAAALLLVLVTTGLIALVNSGWGLLTHVTIENPGTVYIVSVTLAAIFLGCGPALVAVAASTLAVYLAFSLHEIFSRMVVLIATMLIIIALAERQRRAQDAAERVRAQLAAIVESMSDAVMVVDAAGRATNVNHAAIAMLGAADDAEALAKVMHRRPDGTPATDEYVLLERVLGGEAAPQTDVSIPDGTDNPRTVSAVANPMRDARGQIIGAVSVSRDITERLAQVRERERLSRQVEQERQYSQYVLENAPVGIAVVRADDFTLLSFNEEYDASVRRAPGATELAVGKSLLDAMPVASHEAATRLLSIARDEHRLIRNAAYASAVVPDQFYDGTIQPLRLGDETPALLITSVNVTERVRGEQERERLLLAIEQEQQYTRLILDTAPVAIGVVRPDDLMVLNANAVFEGAMSALSGQPFAAGMSFLAVMPGFEGSEFVRQLRRAVAEERTLSVSGYAARIPTGRYYDWTMTPLALQDGTRATLVTFADVTARVQGEREREALLQQVEQQAAQLAATFEAMVDGVAVYDAAGTILHRNEAFYRLLHLEPGAAPPVWEAFIRDMHLRRADGTPLTREGTHSFRALHGETIREEVVLVRDGRGRDRAMSQNAAPIRAADGGVIGAVVVFNDVTERLEQEREREALLTLVEERRRFTQAIFDTVPVALAVVDTDALIFEAANPAYLDSVPDPYRSLGVNARALTTVLPHTRENGFADQLQGVGLTGEPFHAAATRYEHPTRGTTYWNETMIPLVMSDAAAHHVLYIAADVTEQTLNRRTVEELAATAAQRAAELEAVIANMPDGVAIYDADATLIQMNAAGQRSADADAVPPSESLTEAVARYAFTYPDGRPIPPDDLPLARVLRGETVSGYEFVSQTRRGAVYRLASSAPITNAAGEITRAVVMFTDITARKQAEQERERLLREVDQGRAFARTVIDSAPAGIVVFGSDPAFTVRLANDQFLPLLREPWRSNGVIGVSLAEFLPRAEESGILAIFRRVVETGEPVSLAEFEYEAETGRTIYYDWSLVPLREGGDRVTGLILLISDTTDRVLSRQQIEELADVAAQRAAELEAIIANMPIGVAIHRADGHLVQMNRVGRQITGEAVSPEMSARNVVERFQLRYPDGRLIPLDDLPLPRALRGEVVSDFEYMGRTRGERHFVSSSAPIRNAAGEITSAIVMFTDITERRRAEELATRLGRILDVSSNEIYVYDAATLYYVQVNESARRNLGYSADELTAMTSADIKPAFTAESFAALLEPLRAGERDEVRFETVHRRKDGSLYPIDALIQISRTETPPVFVSIIQDITERHAAEQQREQLLKEIDERRRFVQTVVESAPVGIAVFATDAEVTVRIANDQYLQALDEPWRSAGIAGRGVREFIPPEVTETLLSLYRSVVESGESIFLHEFEQTSRRDATAYVDWSLVPLVESGDRVTGVLSLVSDVTERVQSRQRIEELAWDAAQRASELETVIASIADGVTVTDAAGRIVLENDASRSLTGRVRSAVALDLATQVETQHLRNADGTPLPPHELPLGRAVRGETVTDQVLIVRRADTGEDRFLIYSSAPVQAVGGAITGAVAVFRDITEMKQLDQMKDEFISIAAHELRTPLTAIKGYAELLDRRLSAQGGREGDRKSLGVIRKQTERLSGLVNEMLDVSRIEAGRLQLNSEPFDLSALVGEVVSNVRVSTTTHDLSLTADPAIEVFGDTARIEQVLINLISNAITYSPEGGDIGVRVWTEGASALVSVNDHGIGISQEDLPHLFDRFYRAQKADIIRSGGMGLGLYICQEIVTRHGGTIHVESTEGAGSTFTFTVPLAREGLRTKWRSAPT